MWHGVHPACVMPLYEGGPQDARCSWPCCARACTWRAALPPLAVQATVGGSVAGTVQQACMPPT